MLKPKLRRYAAEKASVEVVQALAVEQGYAPHLVKSCEDIMAAGGCSTLKNNGYSEICCASCAPIYDRVHGGEEMRAQPSRSPGWTTVGLSGGRRLRRGGRRRRIGRNFGRRCVDSVGVGRHTR